MPIISELYTYPIKSFGGISLKNSYLDKFGLTMDRRFMLIDSRNKFMSQREIPELALFRLKFQESGFMVEHLNHKKQELFINIKAEQTEQTEQVSTELNVQIWDDNVVAESTSNDIDTWFSDMLHTKVRLVQMPDRGTRQVDTRYAPEGTMTAFSDEFPILLISQASLDNLNDKLFENNTPKITMDRFRPNIVVSNTVTFEEDTWQNFQINGIKFTCAKPCARCTVTTINQQTAIAGKEPLKTLATYRKFDNKVLFGQNITFEFSTNMLSIGQEIKQITLKL